MSVTASYLYLKFQHFDRGKHVSEFVFRPWFSFYEKRKKKKGVTLCHSSEQHVQNFIKYKQGPK